MEWAISNAGSIRLSGCPVVETVANGRADNAGENSKASSNAGIWPWRRRPGATVVAEVQILVHPGIISGFGNGFDEPARLALCPQAVRFSLDEHCLNVMIDFADGLGAGPRKAENRPEIGFKRAKVEQPACIRFG